MYYICIFGYLANASYMKKWCAYIILMLFLVKVAAQDKIAYDTLFNRVHNLPSEEVIKLGDEYLKKEYTDTAIVLYSLVYNRFYEEMSEKEKLFCAIGYLKMGNIYYMQGNYTSALDLYIKGLKICETCKDKKDMSRFYNNIGNIYCIFQDYEKGTDCYKKGYENCKLYPDKENEYKLLVNLSGISSYIKDTEKARRFYFGAEKLKQPGDTIKNYMSLFNWGLIMKNEGKYAEAIQNFRKAASYSSTYEMNPSYLCSVFEELYKTFDLMDIDDSTMYYINRCMDLAEKNNLLHLYSQPLKTLYRLYEKKGDLKNAILFQKKYLSIIDSIFNVREFNRVKNVQYLYEMEKTAKEISSLHADQKKKEQKIGRQRKVLFYILSGTVLISFLLVLVYIQKRKIQRSYRDLFHINREIMESQQQNKEIQQQYKERLQKKEERLVAVYKQLNRYRELQNEPPIDNEENLWQTETSEINVKYQTSSLNKEQKQVLADAISNVMETTRQFCEPDFSLEKLATLVNSNSKYVSQVINEMYQKNFSNYVNDYRIREARIRLMDIEHYGNYTIKAIAESLGYKSHATFINVFRKITGITPSIYQKMAKEQA